MTPNAFGKGRTLAGWFFLGSLLLLPITAGYSGAQTAKEKEAHALHAGSLELPPDLREILLEEMREVEVNARDLVPALARGDWKEAENLAGKIEGSYILKKKLTREQEKKLHAALPELFQQMDEKFHETARRLGEAAKNRDSELSSFYFYRLTQSCQECHGRFAPERFPGFKEPSKGLRKHPHGH